MLRRAFVIAALQLIVFMRSVSAQDFDVPNGYPTEETRSYVEYASHGEWTGPLRLSSKFASFKAFRGHLDLEFVKQLPRDPTDPFTDMRIYRIVNAEKFFADNKGRGMLGRIKTKWLGLHPLSGAYGSPPGMYLQFIDSETVPEDIKDVYQHTKLGVPYFGASR